MALFCIGSLTLIFISLFGILVNSYCLFKFLRKSGKFSGFYKLCIVKTIPNIVICGSFLFWAGPLTLLQIPLKDVPRSINTVMGQIAGSGAYVLGECALPNVFQDCLHVIDLINCRYIFALRDETCFQFIFLSVSFFLIYSLDGFVMFYFHRDVQPEFLKRFMAYNGLRRKSNAIEAFKSGSSI
ncbi:unnamed protein product [Caenorhabditis brenneri]